MKKQMQALTGRADLRIRLRTRQNSGGDLVQIAALGIPAVVNVHADQTVVCGKDEAHTIVKVLLAGRLSLFQRSPCLRVNAGRLTSVVRVVRHLGRFPAFGCRFESPANPLPPLC